ncbi:MAG TPA: ABC transporter ATP-binding protein [Devosiaceae bacterium]|nr:ABC transporter ATP-binding protein [Devosiaceae bacterium]
MTAIILDAVNKRFGANHALADIDLELASGSFTALLGPSGCGKTTLLRLIAGFEAPSDGTIRFGDRVVASPQIQIPPEKREVGVVFQSYALWPHMDVAQNVAYPLRTRGMAGAEIGTRVRDVLEVVCLSGFAKRPVDQLSGGQRQRVALARCLVADTGIILFDEPLANLDAHLRASMIEVLRDIRRRVAATIVYVTHDQAEALALADRIAVLDHGRIQQFATPQEIYSAPGNGMIAGFVGRGSVVSAEGDGEGVGIAGYRFPARGHAAAGSAKVLLRPEALRLGEDGIPARVVDLSYKGPVYEVLAALEGTGERLVLDVAAPVEMGAEVRIAVSDAWVVPAEPR